MAIELVIGIGFVALLAGSGIGYFMGKGRGKQAQARVQELEDALESSRGELTDYRSEVYNQFAETAEKFRALDQSYNDLHRQLATSSAALIGDDAKPLLAGPGQDLLQGDAPRLREEKEVAGAAVAEEPTLEPEQDQAAAGQPTDDSAQDQEPEQDQEVRSESSPESSPESSSESGPEAGKDEQIVVAETSEVPTLTTVEAETEDKRQQSA